MINFSPKKIKTIVIIVLTIVSFLPIIKTFGRINIGYDTLIPPIPEFSYKTAYQWNDMNNGLYISNNYFIWISVFNFFSFFGLNIYQTAFIYQFLIFFLSGYGIYNLHNLFNKKNPLFGLLPAILIILSPHYLDHYIYYIGAVGIIWSIFFFFKFIRNKKFYPLDIFGIALSLGIISDLPNPKYHFILIIVILVSLTLALILRLISLKNIITNSLNFFFIFLSTLYLSLPFIFYGFNFLMNTGVKIFVKEGYRETGLTLDYGYALLSKMIRLFHTPGLDIQTQDYVNSPFFGLAYYIYPIIVLGLFPFIFRFLDPYKKKIYSIFYFLILFLLFISKSSNPPFGFVYDFLITNFSALAFMRTTNGVIIFAAVFYSLILGIVFQTLIEKIHDKYKYAIILFFVSLFLLIGYHMWSGQYFISKLKLYPNLKKNEYGIKIPEDYFKSAGYLKNQQIDSKIDIYPFVTGYQNSNWGYYGFLLYPWLIDKPMISFDNKTHEGQIFSQTNALYIYHDKTLQGNYSPEELFQKPDQLVFNSGMIDIYRKKLSNFLPHFLIENTFKESNSINNATLEFKKINPAKYRVIIHKSLTPINLVFNENFHKFWKIYIKKYKPDTDKEYLHQTLNQYYESSAIQIDYHANREDISDYINSNSLSTLGDLKEKNKIYYEYNNEKLNPRKIGKYSIGFISKKIKGTIQNNNLSDGNFYETFSLNELNVPHNLANTYANGWQLEPSSICSNPTYCFKNDDGSHDFELVVEFWPQKLANISSVISTFTLFILLLFQLLRFLLWNRL